MISDHVSAKMCIEFLEENHFQWLTVRSKSMEPLIQARDEVLVAKMAGQDPSVGDVVVFNKDCKLIMHRILAKTREESPGFIEKGDNNPMGQVIPGQDMIGKVVAIKRKGSVIHLDTKGGRSFNVLIAFVGRFIRSNVILRSKLETRYRLKDKSMVMRIIFGLPRRVAFLTIRVVTMSYISLSRTIRPNQIQESVPDMSVE